MLVFVRFEWLLALPLAPGGGFGVGRLSGGFRCARVASSSGVTSVDVTAPFNTLGELSVDDFDCVVSGDNFPVGGERGSVRPEGMTVRCVGEF